MCSPGTPDSKETIYFDMPESVTHIVPLLVPLITHYCIMIDILYI